jgi:hypothetical protein
MEPALTCVNADRALTCVSAPFTFRFCLVFVAGAALVCPIEAAITWLTRARYADEASITMPTADAREA